MANVKELKNGDLIMVKLEGEEAKAKFLKASADETKINVFVKSKLKWIPSEDFIGMAEPLSFVGKSGQDAGKPAAPAPAKEKKKAAKKAEKAAPNEPESTIAPEAGKDEGEGAQAPEELKLSQTQSKILTALAEKSKPMDILTLAEVTGILNPQIRKASEGLVSAGLITFEEKNETGAVLEITEKGKTFNPMAKKAAKKAPKKVKAKKEGDASAPSKRDQVLNLLKNKDLSIEDIAEKLDTDPNYVREIKASTSKKMEEPDKNSTKGIVFAALKKGKSAKEVAASAKVSTVYVYKIQKQMQSAGLI